MSTDFNSLSGIDISLVGDRIEIRSRFYPLSPVIHARFICAGLISTSTPIPGVELNINDVSCTISECVFFIPFADSKETFMEEDLHIVPGFLAKNPNNGNHILGFSTKKLILNNSIHRSENIPREKISPYLSRFSDSDLIFIKSKECEYDSGYFDSSCHYIAQKTYLEPFPRTVEEFVLGYLERPFEGKKPSPKLKVAKELGELIEIL